MKGESNPGVPEALPRVLRTVAAHVDAESVDRVWIFPPLRKGRKEWGLVALSRYDREVAERAPPGADADTGAEPATGGDTEGEDTSGDDTGDADPDRRRLYTAAYTAERTGRRLSVEPVLTEEGRAPLDRLPRVMRGVVRRSGDDRGEPREVAIGGDTGAFEELVEELEGMVDPEPGSKLDP